MTRRSHPAISQHNGEPWYEGRAPGVLRPRGGHRGREEERNLNLRIIVYAKLRATTFFLSSLLTLFHTLPPLVSPSWFSILRLATRHQLLKSYFREIYDYMGKLSRSPVLPPHLGSSTFSSWNFTFTRTQIYLYIAGVYVCVCIRACLCM